MKNYKVTLKIVSTDHNEKIEIEHSDTFLTKTKKDAERMAIEKAKKDLVFNCKISVLHTKEV